MLRSTLRTEPGVTVNVAVAAEDAVADGFTAPVAADTELEEGTIITVSTILRPLKPFRSATVMETAVPGTAVEGTANVRVLSSSLKVIALI